MKKSIIGILIIIGLICSLSCVIADAAVSDNPKDIQTISKNGISIKFPADWGISKASSNYSLVAISNLASIDGAGIGQVNINFEKKPIEGSFDSFVNDTYARMQKTGDYQLSSSGQIAVGQYQGYEYSYVSDIDGVVRQHKAIWIEHNDEAYVILYSAPQDQFDANLKVFDYVVRNFQIN